MITIPDWIWERMLDAFAQETRDVERVAYLDGVLVGSKNGVETGVVTTLTFPNADLYPGYFSVTPEAMSEAGEHLHEHNLCRLAQVHTHPGSWTGHSEWDDRRAYSQWPGAISIVLPSHARFRPQLKDAGVHLRTEDAWQEVAPDHVSQYLQIVSATLDFRRKDPSNTQPNIDTNLESKDGEHIEPTRKRPWWKAFTFWKH